MYEYITGKISFIYPSYVVVETNDIGYKLLMANPFRYTEQWHKEATVYVYQDVRQDAILLFGFQTIQEKQLFLKLINVSGIGPKSALAILANDNHQGFIQAVENNDTTFLMKFPGVGKKTASQIVLDLKGKLSDFDVSDYTGSTDGVTGQGDLLSPNHHFNEAMEALLALGYAKRDIERVKKQLDPSAEMTTDAYIREALSKLI